MPLPGKRYTDWTSKDLDLLVDKGDPAYEGQRLDFKKECHLLRKDGGRKQARRDILVDIASMANAAGGTLLLGADDDREPGSPGKATELTGIPRDDAGPLEDSIRKLVEKHLDVRPAPLRIHPVPINGAGDRVVLVVEVEPNTYSLSMVTYKDLYQFWVRRGADNCRMMTDEIQYRFGEMEKVREKASEALGSIRAEFMSRHPGVPFSWFVAVPYQRARDHVPVDVRKIREIILCSKYYTDYPGRDGSQWTPKYAASNLAPSLDGIGMNREYEYRTKLELRRDGTLTFCVVPATFRRGNSEAVPLDCAIYEPWCSSLYLLQDVQQEFGISPVYVIQAGLVNVGGLGIFLRTYPLGHWRSPENEVTLDAITLSQDWDPKTEFMRWAKQFANYLGYEEAIEEPPWVTVTPPGQ